MVSPFDLAATAARPRFDAILGETFLFTPMREVKNAAPVADSSRDPLTGVVAIFADPGLTQEVGTAPPLGFSTSGPALTVDAGNLPQGVIRFDRFKRDKTGKVYEARAIQPDGFGRLVVSLAGL